MQPHEQLSDLYSSPNIVWTIKSRKMRWAGHVASTGEKRGVDRILVGKPETKRPLGKPCIDGMIILIWIFRKWDEGHGLDSSGSGEGQVAGTSTCSHEPSRS
jgi:hypothetical protein